METIQIQLKNPKRKEHSKLKKLMEIIFSKRKTITKFEY